MDYKVPDTSHYPTLTQLLKQPAVVEPISKEVQGSRERALGAIIAQIRNENQRLPSGIERFVEQLTNGLNNSQASYFQSRQYDRIIDDLSGPLQEIEMYGIAKVVASLNQNQKHELSAALNHYGNALTNKGRHQDAIRVFRTALLIEEDPTLYYNLGIAQRGAGLEAKKSGNLNQAREFFDAYKDSYTKFLELEREGARAEGVIRALRVIEERHIPSVMR